jgi:capsular polysaccharide biosynthesis protein
MIKVMEKDRMISGNDSRMVKIARKITSHMKSLPKFVNRKNAELLNTLSGNGYTAIRTTRSSIDKQAKSH